MMELLTTAEMAEADRLTIAGGIAGIDLMENAGRAVADRVAALHGPACADGGGAGQQWGRWFRRRTSVWPSAAIRCALVSSGDRRELKGDAAQRRRALERAARTRRRRLRLPTATSIIDALFGAGLDREVDGLPAGHDRGDKCRHARRSSRSICRAASTATPARSWGWRSRPLDGDILPAKAGPPAAAGTAALRDESR